MHWTNPREYAPDNHVPPTYHIIMNLLKHLLNLIKDLFAFAYENKAWWIIPLVVIFLGFSLIIVVGETSAPFIYTLF